MKNKIKNKFPNSYSLIRRPVIFGILYMKLIKRFFNKYKLIIKKHLHIKPRELQLPITYKCNFDCVMCGMQTLVKREDFSKKNLEVILKNKLFKKIESVGVNGGEPFLKQNLDEYIEVICKSLPNLKNIYIITNGALTNMILNKLVVLKKICSKYKVKLNISVSVDGVGEIQNIQRGNKLASTKTFETIREISNNKSTYCDSINAICTITRYNIFNINEVEVWSKENGVVVNYNIATIHKRINNEYKYKDFSIFEDEYARKLAAEFFYGKFLEDLSERYYAIYLYIKEKQRYYECTYQFSGVTITPNCQILYCATYSDELGNASIKKANKLYYKNYKYKHKYEKKECKTCSHYIYGLSFKGFIKYIHELKNII